VRTCHKANGLIVYSMGSATCKGKTYMPTSVATGRDGALWFTTYKSALIGRTTTAGVTTFYRVPATWNGVWGNGGITSGSDGALWFIANSGLDIGRITTSGSVSTFLLPPGIGLATAITSGPDGALWFTVYNSSGGPNAIGRITTTGQFTIFTDPGLGTGNWQSPTHRALPDITSADGALWFTCEYASNVVGPGAASIGRITTAGVVTSYPIPFNANPGPLTAGPDGAIWFAGADAFGGNGIGRVTPSGVFSEFSGSGKIGQVLGLAAGPDGALWFTNYSVPGDTGYRPYAPIGRITTKGTVTTYGSPSVEKGAMGITAGSDGGVWFIDHLNDTIGRVSVP
jgi:virginiamycin B lyase